MNSLSDLYNMYRRTVSGVVENHRVTTRVVRLPDDLSLIKVGAEHFRPVVLRETFSQDGDQEQWYRLEVTGPVQTKAGRDHAVRRESAVWYIGDWEADWITVPDELLDFVSSEETLGGPWPTTTPESETPAWGTSDHRPANHSSLARRPHQGEPGPVPEGFRGRVHLTEAD